MNSSAIDHCAPTGFFARRRRKRLHSIMRRRPELPEYSKRAIVFAPHQDDEVLGCGGTIIKKIAHGADVDIVFMTNGRRSHAGMMEVSDLIALRETEALNAARVLGVAADRVSIFDLPDGKLNEHRDEGTEQVRDILARLCPEEVYVPSRYDGPDDHLATYQFVMDALNTLKQTPRIVEYAVWFWHHWPWVRPDKRIVRSPIRAVANAVLRPMRMYREFNVCVDISSERDQKLAALAAHESQVQRLMPNCEWPILSDVSDGAWVAACTQDIEIFSVRNV